MRSFFSISLFTIPATAIWPIPLEYQNGDTVLWISKDVPFHWSGASSEDIWSDESVANQAHLVLVADPDPNHHTPTQDNNQRHYKSKKHNTTPSWLDHDIPRSRSISGEDIINQAIKSAQKTIFSHNLYPWKFRPRDWKEPIPKDATHISAINVKLLTHDPEHITKTLVGKVDESYAISLTKQGTATISANTSIGIAHGLTTFTQLFYQHSEGGVYTPFAPIQIYDAPKFPYRGLNLDISRSWYPVSDIKRQIDALAYNKMNRLHLHITDSQSWPLEIPALPRLAEKGAYRPNLIYTPADFKEIQHHAAIQGIEVITEIDMPGHTSSIWHSYPDLIAAYEHQPDWQSYAAEPPSGTLKLNSSAVYTFLETLFSDLLPRISPYSTYFHTGGDEVDQNAYKLDDTVRSGDKAVIRPLMQKFIDRNHDQVRTHGLTPIVWEEMLLDWDLELGADVVVQSWRTQDAVRKIVGKGYKTIVGNNKFWYLDCGKGEWLDYPSSNSAFHFPYQDYCAPFHNWRLMYTYDPLADIPEDKQHLIIGGEAHLWSEQTDPVNMDQMIWPRVSAAAEVLWSGAKDENGQNRSQIEASPRLSEMRERLVLKGIGAEPVQMPYCTMNGTLCQWEWKGS